MLRGIATSTLPQTIQDAIIVTRKLGLQYLWVDALCIIQDSASDRAAEIAKMDRIYQNAQLTISAASAERCQDGFLATRSGDYGRSTNFTSIPYACPNGERGNVLLRDSPIYESRLEPLNGRGWALQESVLSSRILIYSSWQLQWQCQSRKKWDGGRAGYFITDLSELAAAENLQFEDESSNCNIPETQNSPWTNWRNLVSEYSKRGLTKPSDKLPALAGVASRYQNDTNDIYCAGLWKANLLTGLKWQVAEPADHRPNIYRAPTWSWASVFGTIIWMDHKPLVKNQVAASTAILDCHVTPEEPLAPLSKVSKGTLIIRGVSRALRWDGDCEIPRRDLENTWVPASERGIGSPLWPDGVIAHVRPDFREETVDIEDESGDGTVWEVGFFMGLLLPDSKRIRRPVVFVVLDGESALMLAAQSDDGISTRLGLVGFKDEEMLEQYFEGCEEQTFIIQ